MFYKKEELPQILKKNKYKLLFILLGLIGGAVGGALLIFHVLFLSHVLPHGGIW